MFTEPRLKKLKREVRFLEKKNEYWRTRARKEERRTAAYKGVATRIRNRVARGECPSCNQSFADLAKHMAEEHPEYAEAEEAEA